MPPIEIPRVQSIGAPEPQSVGRLQMPALNVEGPADKMTDAVDKLGQTAIQYQDKIADQTADTIATNASNQLEMQFKKKMYGDPETGAKGLKYMQGDPDKLYPEFDKQMQGIGESLSKPQGDDSWSPETQTVVNRRLNKKAQELQLQSLTEYGNQSKKYDDNTTEDGVTLAQQGMPDASTLVQPGNDSSFKPLEDRIDAIRQLRIKQAVRYGNAVHDENGTDSYTDKDGNEQSVTLGDSVKVAMSQDVSKGLYDTLDNLVKSGDLDKAKAIQEKYGNMLDPVSKDKLAKSFDKEETDQDAYDLAEKIGRGADPATVLKDADPEVKHKALQFANENDRALEALKDRKSKDNYNAAANYVLKQQQNGTEYAGPAQLDQDPYIKHIMGNITDAKQRQALYHMVDQPKDSSDSATAKMQNLMFGNDPNNDIRTISPEDFNQYLAGLSKSDRRKYQNKYEAMQTETGAQLQTKYKNFGVEFDKQAVGAGLLNKNAYGKFSGSDEVKEIQMKEELQNTIDKTGPMTPKEIQDWVGKFVADKKAGQVFSPPVRPKFQGTTASLSPDAPANSGKQTPPADNNVSKILGNVSAATRLDYMRQYKSQYKTMPNASQLADFISQQTTGK